MFFRSMLLLFPLCALVADLPAKPFARQNGCCLATNRALVLYQGQLFAMESGSCKFTEYMKAKRYESIVNKLPPEVMIISALSASRHKDKSGEIHEVVEYRHYENKKEVTWFMLAETDQVIRLVKDMPDSTKGLYWNPSTVSGEHVKDSYHIFNITIATEESPVRYIDVSKEPLVLMNDKTKEEIRLYPLVLGERNNSAKFQTIEFSGK